MKTVMIPITEKSEIEQYAKKAVVQLRQNQAAMNRFVMEGVSLLSASKARQRELEEEGAFTRIFRELSGKNHALRNAICRDQNKAMYAIQQVVTGLARENAMGLELIGAVNRKLDRLVLEQDEDVLQLQKALQGTLDKQQQLADRLGTMEASEKLTRWGLTIQQSGRQGIKYAAMGDLERLSCIVNDFYHCVDGRWRLEDVLVLKTALANVGIDLAKQVSYSWLGRELQSETHVLEYLCEGVRMTSGVQDSTDGMSLFWKNNQLCGPEQYIVQGMAQLVNHADVETVRQAVLDGYQQEKLQLPVSAEISLEDLAQDLLLGLQLADQSLTEADLAAVMEERVVVPDRELCEAWQLIGVMGNLLNKMLRVLHMNEARPDIIAKLAEEKLPAIFAAANHLIAQQNQRDYLAGLSPEEKQRVDAGLAALRTLHQTAG